VTRHKLLLLLLLPLLLLPARITILQQHLESMQSLRELLMFCHDSTVRLLEVLNIFGRLAEDGPLPKKKILPC
jgi:hypothetical protein